MIYDTSYRNDLVREEINRRVGKPFTLMKRLQMMGNGSERMKILDASIKFYPYLNRTPYSTWASIELRPKGILVFFKQRERHFTWIIPYHQLSLFKSKILSIYGQGNFLKLEITGRKNSSFLRKLMNEKAKSSYENHPPFQENKDRKKVL